MIDNFELFLLEIFVLGGLFLILVDKFITKWSTFHDAWLEQTLDHNEVYRRHMNLSARENTLNDLLERHIDETIKRSKPKAKAKAKKKKVTKKS